VLLLLELLLADAVLVGGLLAVLLPLFAPDTKPEGLIP
jgi:hypothetical protein